MSTHPLIATSYLWRPYLLAKCLGKLYWSIACCTGRILHGHIAIITKPSPHYVLTEPTVSGLWRSNGSRPSPEIKSGSGLGTRLDCYDLPTQFGEVQVYTGDIWMRTAFSKFLLVSEGGNIHITLVPRPHGRRKTAWYRLLANAQS